MFISERRGVPELSIGICSRNSIQSGTPLQQAKTDNTYIIYKSKFVMISVSMQLQNLQYRLWF